MYTAKLKHTEGTAGRWVAQNPDAKSGFDGRVMTLEVADIPDGTSLSHVILLANGTAFWPQDISSVTFSELGPGNIVRR